MNNISERLKSKATISSLVSLNSYLLKRHKFHLQHENYDKLEWIVDLMDETDLILKEKLSENFISKYQPNNK